LPLIEVAVAAPIFGVVKEGDVARTIFPEPVVVLPKAVTVPLVGNVNVVAPVVVNVVEYAPEVVNAPANEIGLPFIFSVPLILVVVFPAFPIVIGIAAAWSPI